MKLRLAPLLVVWAPVGLSAQTTVKLSGQLAHHPGGGVGQYQLSADGSHCVYLADQDEYERHDLYAVATDGSAAPVRLTAALPSGSELFQTFALSSDGGRVAFLLDRFDTGTELSLHSVPGGSSEPLIELAEELVVDASGFPLAITRDGSRVVYRENVLELRLSSVRTDGSGAPIELFAGAPVTHFELSPDEAHVLFVCGGTATGLWRAPLDGSAPATPLHALPEGHTISSLRFSADSPARIVYLAAPAAGPRELYALPLDGAGGPQRLNAALVPGGSVSAFELTADGARVVYRADQELDDVEELFLTQSWNPSTWSKLVTVPPTGDVTRFALLSDGRGLAFLADLASDDVVEAWLVPLAPGAAPRRLNEPLTSGGDVLELEVTSDASHVVYRADARLDGRAELWSVPLAKARRLDPRAVRLNPPLAPGAGVERFFLDAATRRVVFALDPDGPFGIFDLSYHSVPYGGGTSVALGLPRPGTFVPRSTGNGLLLANGRLQHAFGGFHLFAVPSDGRHAPLDLSGPIALGPWVAEVQPDVALSPDGAHAFYRADQGDLDGAELFRAPSTGSTPASALNSPLPLDGSVTGFRLAPDGAQVAYTGLQRAGQRIELFLVAADASAPPQVLHERTAGFLAEDLVFTPDGARILHRAGADPAQLELFSVRADGSAAPLALNGALVAGGSVLPGYALTASGARVVYRADESEDERVELWSAPVDGSAARLRLHAPLASSRDVLEFKLAPLGERVLFRADLEADEVIELYSVLAAGASPLKLSSALVAGGDVVHCAISPDGLTVAYVADQLVDNRFELFRVPLDGSAPAVRLNANLVGGGDVVTRHNTHELHFSADSTRVLYVADALVNDRFELFSVLLAGGSPPVRLNPTLGTAGDVGGALASWTWLALTLDGTRVVFLANPSDAARQLYVAPLDGTSPVTVLAAPAPQAAFDRLLLDDDGAHMLVVSRDFQGSRLLLVPLDGSFAPLELAPPTPTLEPLLVPGQDRVLQRRAPQGPVELFSTGR